MVAGRMCKACTRMSKGGLLAGGGFAAVATPAAVLLTAGTDLGRGKARIIALGRLNGLNQVRFRGAFVERHPQVAGLFPNVVDLELVHGASP